jgi:hypothetical protein
VTTELPAGVPRRNGELVFDAPWETRAFGMVAAYLDATGQGWDEFRPWLIEAIAEQLDAPYYEAWTIAFGRLLTEQGIVGAVELDARADALA